MQWNSVAKHSTRGSKAMNSNANEMAWSTVEKSFDRLSTEIHDSIQSLICMEPKQWSDVANMVERKGTKG